jgi:hypothetical protein
VVNYLPAVGHLMGAVFSFHGPSHRALAPQASRASEAAKHCSASTVSLTVQALSQPQRR